MGMYTGLRLRGIVKEDYRKAINILMSSDWDKDWYYIEQKFKMNFLENFSQLSRSNMIPFGGLSYMPDKWEYLPEGMQDKWGKLQTRP